jgi:hypothetical protein
MKKQLQLLPEDASSQSVSFLLMASYAVRRIHPEQLSQAPAITQQISNQVM